MDANRRMPLPGTGLTRSTVVLAVMAIIAVLLLPTVSAQSGGNLQASSDIGAAPHPLISPGLGSAVSPDSTAIGGLSSQPVPLTLKNPHPYYPTGFGYAVAISGATAVVGAFWTAAPGGLGLAGAAYVFSARTGALIFTLMSPHAQGHGHFAMSVAISGTMIVAGAPGETVSGHSYAGRAYVFSAMTGALISTLASPNAQDGYEFGYSVAISGTTVVVGEPGYDDVGRAYVFNATTGALISTLTRPAGNLFGLSVAIHGTTVAIGGGASDYIFKTTTGALIATFSPGGRSVAIAISGSTVVVGTGDPPSYVFKATTGTLISTLSLGGQSGSGSSVAISGSTVMVGCDVFNATTGALIATLSPGGSSGAISGSTAVVGNLTAEAVPGSSYWGYDNGLAYVFKGV